MLTDVNLANVTGDSSTIVHSAPYYQRRAASMMQTS